MKCAREHIGDEQSIGPRCNRTTVCIRKPVDPETWQCLPTDGLNKRQKMGDLPTYRWVIRRFQRVVTVGQVC